MSRNSGFFRHPLTQDGGDLFLLFRNNLTFDAGGGNDYVVTNARGATIDLGTGNDFGISFGTDTVIDGGAGDDQLFGSSGETVDSLWGNVGDDIIRAGGGSDYALGGQGNDLTDTGEGLGIHFGGAGNDTFFIGREIVHNGKSDTVIALDFGNGNDRLAIAPEILARVASVEGGQVDLAPVLAQFAAEGLSVEEVGVRLTRTDLGAEAFSDVAAFLANFSPDAQGCVLTEGTTVTTLDGDVIIALGVTPDQLLAAVA